METNVKMARLEPRNREVFKLDFEAGEVQTQIKNIICRDASSLEYEMFMMVCRSTGLNPFTREIYWIPKIGPYISHKGYLRIANRSGQFDGMEPPVLLYEDANGNVSERRTNKLFSVMIRAWRKDQRFPAQFESLMSSYNKPQNTNWKQYPELMLTIKAERGALMKAFPVEGAADAHEMDEQELPTIKIEHEVMKKIKDVPKVVGLLSQDEKIVEEKTPETEPERTAQPNTNRPEKSLHLAPKRAKLRKLLADAKKALPNKTEDELLAKAMNIEGYKIDNLASASEEQITQAIEKIEGFLDNPTK